MGDEVDRTKEEKYNMFRIAREIGKPPESIRLWYRDGRLPPPDGYRQSGHPFWYRDTIRHILSMEIVRGRKIPKYSDEDLIAKVLWAAGQVDGNLTSSRYLKLVDKPHLNVVLARFGKSWKSVCQRVGIPYSKREKYTKEDTPGIDDKPQPRHPPNIRKKRTPKYSDEDLVAKVLWAAEQIEGSLTSHDYETLVENPRLSVILKRLGGSWEKVCQRAGIPYSYREKYTEDDMIRALKWASQQIDGPLTFDKYHSLKIPPSASVIAAKFGTWQEACQVAGVKSSGHTRKNVDLIAVLRAP